ncbi:MAG: transcriptional repressor LexA [Patescibacteria group bacterium]
MLTRKQKQIYDFVIASTAKKGYAPSLQEIKHHFKLRAVSTVHQHVSALEEMGLLNKQINKPRSITISRSEKLVKVPLLGAIAAGQPLTLFDVEKETIAVPQNRIPLSGDVYALRVIGNSMVEENINDGDIILVKHQSTANNGEKVVALIDNQEATLKKFYKEKNHIRLQPANKNMEPIILRDDRDVSIQGIVLDVIKENPQNVSVLPKIKREEKKYQKLPLNKILLSDVIKGLSDLPSESCDVIIIDPPYNIGKDFGNNIDKRELSEYVSWCKEWINQSIRIMKPAGTMFIYGFSEILAHLSVEIPINKRWLIWHYTNKNVASLNFWQRSHESIICAWKEKPNFNRDDVREPYTEGFLNGAAGKVRKGTVGRFSKGGTETIYNAHAGGALPRDVIKIAALAGGAGMIERWFLCKTCDEVHAPRQLQKHEGHEIMKHPTQKPLELSRRLIRSAIPNKDGVVLVPFVGTGSECVAAKELGQSYIGFEINPDYVRMAEKIVSSVNIS